MNGRLQSGIYLSDDPRIGNSLCVLFLRFSDKNKMKEIRESMFNLWTKLDKLRQGIIEDLDTSPTKRSTGNLTILVGYSRRFFLLNGITKQPPVNFPTMFNQPNPEGGGPIVNDSRLFYSKDVHYNHALDDHILIQFIADTEFYTGRALMETWKEIKKINKNSEAEIIVISGYYTGFHSPTGRNLLGFHDGVSNIKSSERYDQVAIRSPNKRTDSWTIGGTYMSFIRISFNYRIWDQLSINKQEIIIGRNKKTGCPIVAVDHKGRPIQDSKCPVYGTYDVLDKGNEVFRDITSYGNQRLPPTYSHEILEYSHISVTKNTNRLNNPFHSDGRIFRQGFQFIEPNNDHSSFEYGLNFISFQNDPLSLINSLNYQASPPKPNINLRDEKINQLEQFLSINVAGLYFVPPTEGKGQMPGLRMFFE